MIRMKIKDICDLQNGRAFKPSDWGTAGLPIIRIQNLNDERAPFNYYGGKYNLAQEVDNGDLLFSWSGTPGTSFGAFLWNRGKGVLNQHIFKVIPKVEVDKTYLMYALNGNISTIISKAHGGVGLQHITKKELDEIEIQMVSISRQKEIVEILEKISLLIFLRKQQIVKLDELVKARFVEMFGSYPENENAYPVVNVSDIADAGVGVVIKPAQYYVTEECGIKAFRSLNIGEMYIKDSDWVYFSTEGNESNKKSQLHENDLLIVRSGAPGTSCVVTKEFEGCNAVDVIIAHPDLSKVNPWYLCAYINYPHGKKQIEEGTGGAAQQHFNVGKCNNLKVLLPPLEAQNQFAAFVERVDQQKQTVQQSLDKLELMKKALMQEYFG